MEVKMIDFDKAFQDFCATGTGNTNSIREIKNMFIGISPEQLEILHQLMYFGTKWECAELLQVVDNYKQDINYKKINQGLFGSNLKQIVKASSLEEMYGKINSSTVKRLE